MNPGASIVGGIAGAATLTLAHETLRHTVQGAPRMDILGARGLKKVLDFTRLPKPKGQALFEATLLADLVSNAGTYALIGSGKRAPLKGAILGLALGIGAVTLPGPLGLGKIPGRKTPRTESLTIALYTLGGLVAGLVARQVARR
jgi:hypothetical protein